MANILELAIAKIKAGDQEAGRLLLSTILKDNPHNEQAWFWLSQVVELDEQRRECLENVLKLNPDHEIAQLELSALPPSPPALPSLDSSLAHFEPAPKPVTLHRVPSSSPRRKNFSDLGDSFIVLIGGLAMAMLLYLSVCQLGTNLVILRIILNSDYVWVGVMAFMLLGLSVLICALLLLLYKQWAGTRLSLPKALGLALAVLTPLLGWGIYVGAPLFVPYVWAPWLPASAALVGCRPTCQGVQLPGSRLPVADLHEVDLHQANLRGADLGGANLSGANLSQADLSEADLNSAILTGTNLSGADLRGATLRWTDLRGARMDDTTQIDEKWRLAWEIVNRGAAGRNLSGVDLSEADLSDTDLSKADLSGATLRQVNLSNADLSEANLRSAALHEASLREANLYKANFYGANLYDADLTGADLRAADLSQTQLQEASFVSADLRNANLSGAILRSTFLINPRQPDNAAKLDGADLSGANLQGVYHFSLIDWSGVKYDSQTLWPVGISPP
jgi:uncharacterized protein YjbI with pentapeptide repeats